jgi:hypothetical protein
MSIKVEFDDQDNMYRVEVLCEGHAMRINFRPDGTIVMIALFTFPAIMLIDEAPAQAPARVQCSAVIACSEFARWIFSTKYPRKLQNKMEPSDVYQVNIDNICGTTFEWRDFFMLKKDNNVDYVYAVDVVIDMIRECNDIVNTVRAYIDVNGINGINGVLRLLTDD